MSRRNLTEEFKADAVQLVVAQGYSYSKACEAMGVGDTALRRWVAQWRTQQAEPPRTELEVMADRRRIRELEARVTELEREREILKKSTAFFVEREQRSRWVFGVFFADCVRAAGGTPSGILHKRRLRESLLSART